MLLWSCEMSSYYFHKNDNFVKLHDPNLFALVEPLILFELKLIPCTIQANFTFQVNLGQNNTYPKITIYHKCQCYEIHSFECSCMIYNELVFKFNFNSLLISL
jgi:hypothetical protein